VNSNLRRAAATAACGVAGLAAALAMTVSASASAAAAASSGAGIGAAPVCLGTPLQPGHAYQMDADGLTPGVLVTNPGSSGEDLSLTVTRAPGQLPARAVPAGWVSFDYGKTLGIWARHSISLGAGGSATVPVTVSVPAGARAGTYAGGLAAQSVAGDGGVQLGAGAATLLVFTVGISKPHWSPLQMAATGNCWAPPGGYVPWQQWAGTPYATPPPGWYWQASPAQAWVYTPPPGWYFDWSPGHEGNVYRGGYPVQPCANPASYPDPQFGSFIGGQVGPDTSTAVGCAQWLAASRAGTLRAEPVLGGGSERPAPPIRLAAAAATTAPAHHDSRHELEVMAVAAVGGAFVIALLTRGGGRGRRRRR